LYKLSGTLTLLDCQEVYNLDSTFSAGIQVCLYAGKAVIPQAEGIQTTLIQF